MTKREASAVARGIFGEDGRAWSFRSDGRRWYCVGYWDGARDESFAVTTAGYADAIDAALKDIDWQTGFFGEVTTCPF